MRGMSTDTPEWLRFPGVNEHDLDFAAAVQTLRDLCGHELHLSAPHVAASNSHVAVRGVLTEGSTQHPNAVLFSVEPALLFLREDDFESAERHSADGNYFWVTIRAKSNAGESSTFRLQDTDSI
jgi:hypothetical protein